MWGKGVCGGEGGVWVVRVVLWGMRLTHCICTS